MVVAVIEIEFLRVFSTFFVGLLRVIVQSLTESLVLDLIDEKVKNYIDKYEKILVLSFLSVLNV